MRKLLTLLLAAVLAFPAAGLAYDPDGNEKHDVEAIGDRDVDGSVNFYSIEKEIALGKQLAQDVERHSKIVDDPVISEYVNRVAQNIARNSDLQVPLYVKVIDSDEVNAFALPGGYFFVNTGLIQLAESESELAGVMAHEIAHIAARHGTRQASKGQIAQLATIPLIFMGGGWATYGIYQAANFAIPMTFLKFSRNYEKEADLLGIQYLWKAGYDPTSMVTFFERLKAQRKKKEKGGLAMVFKSHPLNEKRIRLAQEAIDEILPDRPQYALGGSEFFEVKEDLNRLMTVSSKKGTDDPNRPTLKRRAPDDEIPVDAEPPSEEGDDDRPVLKRKYDKVLTDDGV